MPDSFLGHSPYDSYGYGSFGECHVLSLSSLSIGRWLCPPSRAHPVRPSLQGPVPPAAPRASPTAWALLKSPTATWVSPGQRRGGRRGRSPAEPTCPAGTGLPQRCCAASSFPALPSPSPGKGPWVSSPSVQARSGVSAGAGDGQALGNPGAQPCSCSSNSRFPLKGRSSSSGARPPPR